MWSRAEFEQDKQRYEAELATLRERRYREDHPLVRRLQRRVDTVDRVLSGDLSGLIEENTDGPAEPA